MEPPDRPSGGGDTNAARSRALCERHRHGTLATLARDPAGYPFGSLVAYALDQEARPIFLLSHLAEHTANLRSDPRASLLVCEAAGDDPLALGRVTLLGRIVEMPEAERSDARDRYLKRHPEGQFYLQLGDFAFYRLDVETLRYVGGFGRMSWVSRAAYAAAGVRHEE